MMNFEIIRLDEVDSTNLYAKKIADEGANEGTIVVARTQTKGRGRLGRSFSSTEGGLYFTIIVRPDALDDACNNLTIGAAVAVSRAIENTFGIENKIKWVNDIYVGEEKVCGILAEGKFSPNGKIEHIVVGIGINVYSKIPEGASKNGGSLLKKGTRADIDALLDSFCVEFDKVYDNLKDKSIIDEYNQKSYLTDKIVSFTKNNIDYVGIVKKIDYDGRLIVDCKSETIGLNVGEVSVKVN